MAHYPLSTERGVMTISPGMVPPSTWRCGSRKLGVFRPNPFAAMRKRIFLSIAAVIAILVTMPASAAVDPCASLGPTIHVASPRAHVSIQRETAERTIVHVRRACGLLADIAAAHPEPAVVIIAGRVAARLRARVLAPIIREYPDLRDVAASEKLPPSPKPGDRVQPSMGPATAIYLRWAIDDAQKGLSDLPTKDICQKPHIESCFRPIEDLFAEISFAEGPVYLGRPQLWAQAMREATRKAEARTPQSDATFRKSAPPPGAVTLTKAASARVRDYLTSLRREVGPSCEIGAFSWVLSTASKGPDDANWKTTGPQLGFGSFPCGKIPPDVVRRIDGLRLIFTGDASERFANKIIDYEDKKFVLRDREPAKK